MELRAYLTIARRWWWLLALGTLATGLIAYIFFQSQTPVYQARTTLLVNEAQAVTGPTYNDILANERLTRTYSRVVTSVPVLTQAAQELGTSYQQLAPLVFTSAGRDTQLLDIMVQSTDPVFAARASNTIATVFADYIRLAQTGKHSSAESDLENQIANLQQQIGEHRADISRLNARTSNIPDDQRIQQLADAQAELDNVRENLTTVQRLLQELRIDLARSANSVAVIDPALEPQHPIKPRVARNTVIAMAIGLTLAVGALLLIEYLDDTVKHPESVEQSVRAPVLGTIPDTERTSMSWLRRKTHQITPATDGGQFSKGSEAYRILRTNMAFVASEQPISTILISSAVPQEGKSTTTAQLAAVMAQSGHRVIIVDADLRRPRQHQLFKVSNRTGLSTAFVMDDLNISELIRPTAFDGVSLLPSGPVPPNPAELLSSAKMVAILQNLSHLADVVLIDSPPLLGVADSAALATRVEGVIIIVDSTRTRMIALRRATDIIRRANANLLGVVLNKVEHNGKDGYYYGYYGSYDPDMKSHHARQQVDNDNPVPS